VDRLIAGLGPAEVARFSAPPASAGQPQPVLAEEAQHRVGTAQRVELLEDGPQDPLHLLVGIQLVPLPTYSPWLNPIEARPSSHRDAA
jgi:hypothetical protein